MTTTPMAPPGHPDPAVRTVRSIQSGQTVQTLQTVPLRGADHGAVVAMLGRCSEPTLRRRFHGVIDDARYINRLIGSSSEVGYTAWIDGRCVGIASLHPSDQASAEMGVLVEDDWQRRGVGTALVAALATHARGRGLATLTAHM